MKGRLFILSNRMPVTIETLEGKTEVRQSSGGLVSAISGYLEGQGSQDYSKVFWAGIPDVNEKVWKEHMEQTESSFTFMPVFVTKKLYEQYYNGFSNSVLWPLFHYFPSYAEYNEQFFEAYEKVNRQFEQILSAHLRKEDTVWIHDYHLLPLAGLLRSRFPELSIGFFLHIPFPSYEILRIIPRHWQVAILKGMLGADLIGFHTVDYANHFIESLKMILNISTENQIVEYENRKIKIDVFPISIDYEKFNLAAENPEVKAKQKFYQEIAGDRKMIFSVDRLDYTKGIGNRLKGYETFLNNHPEFQDKVVFFLVIVPSRDTIVKYAERKKMIDEFIGNFNSKLGYIGWQPIVYQYGHLSFEELIALYTSCHLALITPLRDGMNLVAKEFVASRSDHQGVLVLSEMAGAAKELLGSLLINPNDVGEMAEMILKGLNMPEEEQAARMKGMQKRIASYDVNTWSADFFSKLNSIKLIQLKFEYKFLDTMERINLLNSYADAGERLFLLDYDGTLVGFRPEPSEAKPSENLLAVLDKLSQESNNTIYIISGRDRDSLEQWFGHLNINLIAEHGHIQKVDGAPWESALHNNNEWKERIVKIMDLYNTHCPGAFTEQKQFSIAWHYRNANQHEAALKAETLITELLLNQETTNLEVMHGHKIIEVRLKGMSKGKATKKILEQKSFDFILSMGDDVTDEDMFKELAAIPAAFSIKIGNNPSHAKYNLHNPEMANSLLSTISNYSVHPHKI